jgi:hypothetical protein
MLQPHKAAGAHYPYLVEPQGDGWTVTFVEARFPHHLLFFKRHANALSFARKLNRSYSAQVQAMEDAQLVIAKVRGMPSTPPEERAGV